MIDMKRVLKQIIIGLLLTTLFSCISIPNDRTQTQAIELNKENEKITITVEVIIEEEINDKRKNRTEN